MIAPESSDKSTVVIGAGPAGLTAAYLLRKAGIPAHVLEADPVHVGGISRTATYKGFKFDIGGHRFFSKSQEVEKLWDELLPGGMMVRRRLSRIYYRGKFFSYPLAPADALAKLGMFESARCLLSYLKARLRPKKQAGNFEDWVCDAFGRRLFEIFFKTYTEKVWGMPCTEISADWAAQRIKNLSLKSAITNAFNKSTRSSDGTIIKTLIDTFRYPREGPGMLWEACAAKIKTMGGVIDMGCRFTGASFDPRAGIWTVRSSDRSGGQKLTKAHHLISTTAIADLIPSLEPRLPEWCLSAASSLKYRDFLTVALIYNEPPSFEDNWIYIHDPGVKVGRVQNFKSWSPHMVPDPGASSYGLEYFCFEGDHLWEAADEDLIRLAADEMEKIGLAKRSAFRDGCVFRQRKAYPVYDEHYTGHVQLIRAELEQRFPTLHLVGRNGMHRYNNQDHSMMTAMLCVRNIAAGSRIYDLWRVNQDAEYIESESEGLEGGRLVPMRA